MDCNAPLICSSVVRTRINESGLHGETTLELYRDLSFNAKKMPSICFIRIFFTQPRTEDKPHLISPIFHDLRYQNSKSFNIRLIARRSKYTSMVVNTCYWDFKEIYYQKSCTSVFRRKFIEVVPNLKWRVVGRLRHTFSSLHNLTKKCLIIKS